MLPGLKMIFLCLILVTASSCSDKLFLKRKYTAGKFLAFKQRKSPVPAEKMELVSVTSTEKIPEEIALEIKTDPDISNHASRPKNEETNIKQKHRSPSGTNYDNRKKRKLYSPPSPKATGKRRGCSGFGYESPSSRIGGICVYIGLLLSFYLLLSFVNLAHAAILLAVVAAILSIAGIVLAFRGMLEGGFMNIVGSVFTILLGLLALAVCVVIFALL